jgi:hypothetical protein
VKIKVRKGFTGWWVVGRYAPFGGRLFPTFSEALRYALERTEEES